MPNFDVRDAYGSVITIESSVVGGANRQVVTTALGNSSVMLLTGTGVIGSVMVLQGTNPWVIGSVSGTVGSSIIGQLPAGTAVLGSVATLQGTNPWVTSGSVQLLNGAGIIGSVTTLQGTNPWITSWSNSSILTTQQGTVISSVINSAPSSLLTGASIFGMLPAGSQVIGSVATLQGTNPWTISGSVTLLNGANVIGSVTALQGTNPWITTFSNSSIFATQQGTVITSVVNSIPSSLLTGIYGHRNDAVASYLGADLSWRPFATDSAGRTLTRPFAAEESRVEGYASTVNINANSIIAAAGTGLRNYITDVWVANTGAAATLVTFLSGGGASVLGYTIAPAGSGSNLPGLVTPIRTDANATFDFRAATGTSVLYITAKGFKAQ